MADSDGSASIGTRLSRQLFIVALVGSSVFGMVVFLGVRAAIVQQQDAQLDSWQKIVTGIARDGARTGVDGLRARVAFYAPRRPGSRLELRDAEGRLLYADPEHEPFLLSPHVREHRFALDTGQPSIGILQARLRRDGAREHRSLLNIAGLLAVFSVISGVLVGWSARRLVRSGLRPLDDLARQVQSISLEQRDGHRLSTAGAPIELQPWLTQFNALLDRNESAYAQLESFNADVAHELRTPLATLIGETEIALSRDRPAEALRETLHSNLEELLRLRAIIADMLFLSRADRGAQARRSEVRSVAACAEDVVEFHEATAEEAGVSVTVEGDARFAIDEALYRRALSNLLGNALRFSTRGSTVRIVLSMASGALRTDVVNAGEEIPAADLPRLFERFYRGDAGRARHDGHGLGLAIVGAIARMHGGSTTAESARGETRIGFTLGPS